jgi:predicted GIY-YIG superfamily endonuclease
MPYHVYVIGLKKEVLNEKKFRDDNPEHEEGKPCVYVGYSSKTPEERYRQHVTGAISKKGHSLANKYVQRYHEGLRPRQYSRYNPIDTVEEAKEVEESLAQKLRKKGYAVWQR